MLNSLPIAGKAIFIDDMVKVEENDAIEVMNKITNELILNFIQLFYFI
jgi:hypothetical protein